MEQCKIGRKYAEQWQTKAKMLRRADDRQPDFFGKCTNLTKAAILLHKSLLERKKFVKLRETQLF